MANAPVSPVVLVILDGWGYRQEANANAIAAANTPNVDAFFATYPSTLIHTSGKRVGLPDGQMGNSEVGHLNLGAGRVVPQELVRISDAIEDGSFLRNDVLVKVCRETRQAGKKLHLIGLCSDGGVHSHLNHLLGLLDLAKVNGIADVHIHAITDGRDTNTTEGINYLQQIQAHIDKFGVGSISTISGRYFAMDRDRRWDRVKQAYDVMTQNGNLDQRSFAEILQSHYDNGVTDEFIPPVRLKEGAIEPGDGVIFYNFRPDRARQLSYALVDKNFQGFERELIPDLNFVTFTQYDANLPVQVAFAPQNLTKILGEVIADNGLKQFRTAETEKYPHVTYFFNGGLEVAFEGEDRELISSPQVATYDQKPEMSAKAVTDAACQAIEKGIYSLVVINYANPDMVGHTGKLEAAVQAIETVDHCLGRLVATIGKMGGTTLITADHGNAEYMADQNGKSWTAHTTNPVPFILIEGERRKVVGHGADVVLRENGCLADVAPTILDILGIDKPQEMTGQSLIAPAPYAVTRRR
ncbi:MULTISPECIES: 2,3-bisphosphoglycerate-independent phosphoglycerate mutase [Cyanophyceae]|uniref:2,3-bisphosphoglycerate-independent phosphoglycerate mutase n=1 Tax=Picosynechococcus sp. (strain ATCC 27264 / PCC 7002 / PR-6) TaxID=32049 RepID=GPMI_PICP2|nr:MULTISPECIES: 2,3-bisphosphoglycerate-independent phosphoglycerate mutase [Cyanophyceae]B1XJ47.1 RecName: Full=2,3-bisphosphoglycerate-independent phosphoglycerate mutase; Short=BPG-independent PGAM; Short=Phosphoglyceromutase; Short=iPGM [Picosynechococcus sp. PCC 7002]ACB00213.1 2,3-bisphosphoglycerate-independent phosphoglycerate mutase [Picosynechococcus sp. PCC 7002]QCS50703.1 2,3-bisphosphoglycerate-independent phosphoglycerate mutase [Picosynechococcus sp. PCC 11901]SMH53053.1 phospho